MAAYGATARNFATQRVIQSFPAVKPPVAACGKAWIGQRELAAIHGRDAAEFELGRGKRLFDVGPAVDR